MSKYTREQINELCDNLYGSMESLTGACRDLGMNYDELTDEDFEMIDEQVFCCEGCGWWEHTGQAVLGVISREILCPECATFEAEEDREDEE